MLALCWLLKDGWCQIHVAKKPIEATRKEHCHEGLLLASLNSNILEAASSFSALRYILEVTATLLTGQKMDPSLQPPTQPCCVWSHGEKGTLREQKTRNLLQLLAQCQGHVCQLFQPDRTLLTTKVTHNPPLKARLHDRNAYTAVAATSQMCCCL